MIFIDDPDMLIECTLSKFTDHNELGGGIDLLEGCRDLQKDMDRLYRSTEAIWMRLNKRKCGVLHWVSTTAYRALGQARAAGKLPSGERPESFS
ncbi:hypothetical protein DUI87_26401 [Hirundo rustica rustica]|uniref:Reverse transcriptase domain-containing protein n=1 Tax=Hirundo rustica rustica TaxID=333673 RepID=A0A3M0J7P3_HIRRU|nr:hypothetical protein DUI87_26401 [Hirundo rustica rustica]